MLPERIPEHRLKPAASGFFQVFGAHAAARRRRALALLCQLLGAIWLLNAAVQAYAWLLPPRAQAAAALLHAFSKPISGAPLWLHPYLDATLRGVYSVGPLAVAAAMVALDLAIALALLTGRWRRTFGWLGIAYSVFCWSVLDSFGFPYANGQTDPGVFVNYALAFLCVLAAANALKSLPGERGAGHGFFRVVRILFGLLWAFDAALKWQPYFLTHFTDQLTVALDGQPAWIDAYIRFAIELVQSVGPLRMAVVVAVVESLLALSLLTGRGLRLSIPLGTLYCLLVWTIAEGWGGPYTSAGTGVRGNVVGNVIIYAVVFLYLWAAMWTPGAKSSTSTWKRRDYEAQVTRLPGEPHARRRANATRSVARRAWRPPS